MMNWLRRFVGRAMVRELRNSGVLDLGSPSNPSPWMYELFGGRESTSSVRVNERRASEWVPIFSGCRFLADVMGSMPIDVFRRLDRGREPIPDHSIAWMYRNGVNPEMSWDRFVSLIQGHAVLWGNGYAQIRRNNAQEPIELWPLNPDRVQMDRDDRGNLRYWVTLPADDLKFSGYQRIALEADDVLHIRGFSMYGILGEGLARICREAIGLGIATDEFAARFFGSGANASGFLKHPALLSKEAATRLEESFERSTSGLSRAHRVKVLEEGMDWQQTTIEPEKAQFLQTRKYNVIEACRILRLPPHILYDLERATFSNIEQQSIELVSFSLLPWVVRWEQEMARQLISDKMRNTVYVKFNVSSLLRGDSAARATYYTQGRNAGWLSVNDIRALEDQNPVKGGDVYLQPLNMVPLGTPPQEPKTLAQPAAPNGKNRITAEVDDAA